MTRQIDAVVEADARSDSKAWWQSIHRIAGKSKRFNATAPSADSTQELAERWAEYGESKFAATSREASRSRVTIPPAYTRSQDIPSKPEIMAHLQALSKNKAPGLSGLPVESYLASPRATEDLIELTQFIFRNEVVPDDMAVGEFVMLHKGKGGTDDMAQYRAVCLEEVGLKLAASIMLARLSEEVGETRSNRSKTQPEMGSGKGKEPKNTNVTKYLPRTQAGFRKGRSTRDNSYALRSLINLAIELRTRLCVTFLDLKQAFDSVSHACLEAALRDAGASDKSIAMFRAVYSMAKGAVRVTGADGSRLISREFDIGRGVLQGDLISPLYFIIALAYVFKESDPGGSAKILGLLIDALFYADDAALLSSTAEEAAKRMDAISKALREMADMEIHLGKTKVVHAQETFQVAKPTAADYDKEEVKKLLIEKCEACGDCFTTVRGLNVHQRQHCDLFRRMDKAEYTVEKVLAARGPVEHRFYLLKYKGYGPKYNKWSPDHWCSCSDKITEFCREIGVAVEDMMPEGPNPLQGKKQGHCYRCIWCNNFFKTSGALKGHHSRKVSDPLGCKHKPKSKSGTLAEKAVKRLRRKEAQKHFDHVCMEGTELENVLCFTYLGSNFEADGDCEQDVKIRMAIAKSTFGKLMEIWKATEISLKQKLRLYNAAVISIVSFGFETWEMPQKLEDSLRGWNARCLAAITGREISQEHRQPTFDLIAKLRARRLKWAGQILRLEPEDSLVHQVLVATAMHDLTTGYNRRSLLMDAEEYTTVEELLALAADRKGWTERVRQIDPVDHNSAAKMATSSMDASAEEWKKGADIHNGLFTG